jgi:hypothetical protein
VKSGSIQLWGEWFGGRPFENYHKVIEVDCTKNDVIVIKFDNGEIATIYNPINIVSTEEEFSIGDASKITFEWFYYGREHTSENLRKLKYERLNNGSILRSETDVVEKTLNKKEPAMRII